MMAGAPGRSGGRRPGAGRPRKADAQRVRQAIKAAAWEFPDPRIYLMHVMNTGADERLRLDAAKALMPYCHARPGEAGKKQEAQAQAQTADNGTQWAGLLQ